MNVRKPVDYSAMFAVLDTLMATDLPQMELHCEIGRLVSGRTEKGAAVAAAEYLCAAYPDATGFSPRNLRRMREFYRTYESVPEVLAEAMTIGWTQNVVILEAELSIQERAWYIRAAGQFGWSKLELQQRIVDHAHLEIVLDFADEVCYTEENTASMECIANDKDPVCVPWKNTGTIAETIEMTVFFAVWFANLRHAYANAPNMVKGPMLIASAPIFIASQKLN